MNDALGWIGLVWTVGAVASVLLRVADIVWHRAYYRDLVNRSSSLPPWARAVVILDVVLVWDGLLWPFSWGRQIVAQFQARGR